MGIAKYDTVIANMRRKWGDKFVEPKTTQIQQNYFNSDVRVEVVSPCGYKRRGTITITTGWQPSLMLKHRVTDSGSWDLIDERDIIVAAIGTRSVRHELPHDKLQVAVYLAQGEKSG